LRILQDNGIFSQLSHKIRKISVPSNFSAKEKLNFEKVILADYALLKKRMMQSADGSCGNVVFCKQEERGAYSRM